MLNCFNINQYKQFHRLKALRHTCKRIEKGKKDACYRILSFDTNYDMVGVIYENEARELRKIVEYKMRKLIQDVMNRNSSPIKKSQTYEEINAELVKSCEKAIEVLKKVEEVFNNDDI